MLLPALAAAREKARRTVCLNNLKQVGIGLESYLGDYGQYFPSSPMMAAGPTADNPAKGEISWTYPYNSTGNSAKGSLFNFDEGRYTDGRGNWVGTGYVSNPSVSTWAAGDYWHKDRQPLGRQRTIFTGWRHSRIWNQNTPPAVGSLNVGPIGLGNLLVGNYMGDARAFYCPSAAGTMPPAVSQYWTYDVPASWGNDAHTDAINSIAKLQQVGGQIS